MFLRANWMCVFFLFLLPMPLVSYHYMAACTNVTSRNGRFYMLFDMFSDNIRKHQLTGSIRINHLNQTQTKDCIMQTIPCCFWSSPKPGKCMCIYIYIYIYLGFSINGGTAKSSILAGFSLINHPFYGLPLLETPIHIYIYMYVYIYIYHHHHFYPKKQAPHNFDHYI